MNQFPQKLQHWDCIWGRGRSHCSATFFLNQTFPLKSLLTQTFLPYSAFSPCTAPSPGPALSREGDGHGGVGGGGSPAPQPHSAGKRDLTLLSNLVLRNHPQMFPVLGQQQLR